MLKKFFTLVFFCSFLFSYSQGKSNQNKFKFYTSLHINVNGINENSLATVVVSRSRELLKNGKELQIFYIKNNSCYPIFYYVNIEYYNSKQKRDNKISPIKFIRDGGLGPKKSDMISITIPKDYLYRRGYKEYGKSDKGISVKLQYSTTVLESSLEVVKCLGYNSIEDYKRQKEAKKKAKEGDKKKKEDAKRKAFLDKGIAYHLDKYMKQKKGFYYINMDKDFPTDSLKIFAQKTKRPLIVSYWPINWLLNDLTDEQKKYIKYNFLFASNNTNIMPVSPYDNLFKFVKNNNLESNYKSTPWFAIIDGNGKIFSSGSTEIKQFKAWLDQLIQQSKQ